LEANHQDCHTVARSLIRKHRSVKSVRSKSPAKQSSGWETFITRYVQKKSSMRGYSIDAIVIIRNVLVALRVIRRSVITA
jgi:hypothetical protein